MMMPMAIKNCTCMTFPALASWCISAELVVELFPKLKTLPAASHTKQKITQDNVYTLIPISMEKINNHPHKKFVFPWKNKYFRCTVLTNQIAVYTCSVVISNVFSHLLYNNLWISRFWLSFKIRKCTNYFHSLWVREVHQSKKHM